MPYNWNKTRYTSNYARKRVGSRKPFDPWTTYNQARQRVRNRVSGTRGTVRSAVKHGSPWLRTARSARYDFKQWRGKRRHAKAYNRRKSRSCGCDMGWHDISCPNRAGGVWDRVTAWRGKRAQRDSLRKANGWSRSTARSYRRERKRYGQDPDS